MPLKSKTGFHVSWTTVTYRSVLLVILGVVTFVSFVLYILFPEQTKSFAENAGDEISDWLGSKGGRPTGKVGQQTASFTAIDGTVRVKRSNSNTWINANFNVPLEKGDVVQTGAEGIAKVVFADNTNYTIKQDSLIVVQENSTNTAQQTQVAVELTTGTVDLSTSSYGQGSKSQVIMAGATASIGAESSALVHNDPRADQHEVLLKRGSGQIARGSEVVKLGEYERVTFKADSPKMTKVKELAPPTLISPANVAPVFVNLESPAPLDFSWTQVPDARQYHVRISRNPYFSSTVYDKKVPAPQVRVSGLSEGAYYWSVQSVDANNKESVESEKNRFTVIAKGSDTVEMVLELLPFVQHGHVIEVKGKTEKSARVIINGSEVPYIANDGSFQFFTPPLPNGENVITVTAQNAKGGVKTKQQKVVIQ
ncbi:MAG: FecR domain-containing protein [Acidobacteriia bacterium]|nr:FecR domain-containing protein [Terriglobia bacterium]